MRPIETLLSELSGLDIKIWMDGDRLRVDAPVGVLTPELRLELDARESAIIQFLRQHQPEISIFTPIHSSDLDTAPLSFTQQRFWFLHQLGGSGGIYNVPIALGLHGELDLDVFEASLNQVVARHEILRTRFGVVNGQPFQVIADELYVRITVLDLQFYPEEQREVEMRRRVAEASHETFDLENGPLFRAALFRMGERHYVFLLCLHHSIYDEWSNGVLFGELSECYQTGIAGRSASLPDLPVQYAEFTVWQRDRLQGELLEKQLAYWQDKLAGAPEVLDFPTDHPHPALQSYSGASLQRTLPVELLNRLKRLAMKERATLFTSLLAVFQVLVYRYSSQEEFLVGMPVANRGRVELHNLIGNFLNTLVLRADLSAGPSFRELLRRVSGTVVDALDHQDLPFEKLIEVLRPTRDLSRHLLFQVMFVVHPMTLDALRLPGLEVRRLKLDFGWSNFDLTLFLTEKKDGLDARMEYKTSLFEAGTIERILDHYQILLENALADPDQPVGRLPILTDAERQRALLEWNKTASSYPSHLHVHQVFEAQVEKTPNAVAVVFGEQRLTYLELNLRANQLAYHLRGLGVGPDVLVGLCVERSLEMMVGLLGVLKAGGAYVPMDPSYPEERLAYMLENARVPVLISQEKFAANLGAIQTDLVLLDLHWDLIARERTTNPPSEISPRNLAYVIYTSGSTGTPKGVMVTQFSLSNHMFWMQDAYPLNEQDRVLHKTPFSFDGAVWELFAPLLVGAQLVIAKPQVDPAYLIRTTIEHSITILQVVPVLLRLLVQEKRFENCRTLRRIFCGGEALPVDLPALLFNLLDVEMVNLYGPAEACINAVTWSVPQSSGIETIPIGRPIANAQAYILDKHLQPLPVGVTGELYIGGAGVGRGYLDSPGLTADRFIPDPYIHQAGLGSEDEGARMYRTGDLARYLPDGNIEFLGRADHQVKVRGFRIELGEIETVLMGHRDIDQAVVLAREDIPGDKRLVAYVISEGEAEPEAALLREYLVEKLPGYMIPSAFVFVERFPLNPSGKVDRSAFPPPDWEQFRDARRFEAPRTAVERLLVDIWEDLLGLENIGVNDNFFEIGGHSILAMVFTARVRDLIQMDLPMTAIFEAPTVAEMSALLLDISDDPGKVIKTAQLLLQLSRLSEEEAQTFLEDALKSKNLKSSMNFFIPSPDNSEGKDG